jgi:hypothetical protein
MLIKKCLPVTAVTAMFLAVLLNGCGEPVEVSEETPETSEVAAAPDTKAVKPAKSEVPPAPAVTTDLSAPIIIDFKKSDWPGIISKTSGLFGAEPSGTWSESDTVTLEFSAPLPKKFTIYLIAGTLGPNVNKEFSAHIGGSTVKFNLEELRKERMLEFDNPNKATTIKIDIPSPISPKELGISDDPRKLGIIFTELRIVPQR